MVLASPVFLLIRKIVIMPNAIRLITQSLPLLLLIIFSVQQKAVAAEDIKSTCPRSEAFCVGKKVFKDGKIYEGEFKYGHPHGQGVMYWDDGGRYNGSFHRGRREGYGELLFPDGTRYEGQWKGGYMTGQGRFEWTNGNVYEGEVYKDLMEGIGTMTLSNGEAYTGRFLAGLAHGEGVFDRNDGSQFVGNSRYGQRHGEGKITWMESHQLLGNWSKGQLKGEAIYEFANGDLMLSYWSKEGVNEQITYRKADGTTIVGNMTTVEEELAEFEGMVPGELYQNVRLGAYGIAMECKANMQYDMAHEYLAFATDKLELGGPINDMIAMQKLLIDEELSNATMARANK